MQILRAPLFRRLVQTATLFAIIASTGQRSLAADSKATTFTFRLQGEPETLDWNRAHTTAETYLLLNLMEGLLELGPQLKVESRLAEKYTISPDGKTYTFHLRKGVKWQDGVPLKAADFVFSWKRLLSPLTAASYAYLMFDVAGAKDFYDGKIRDFSKVGIKALNDTTLEVKLQRPVAYWIYIPTFWVTFPLRQDIVEKHGESWTMPGKMVTLGPYTLTSRELESKVVLQANPNYWGKRGNVQKVVAQIVRDDQTALTLFDTGTIDFMTEIPILEMKRMSSRPELKTFPYLKTSYLGFNVTKFPMSSAKLRRAIAFAIDKKKLVDALGGRYTVASSFLPPGITGHDPKDGLPFDVLRARSEFRMSGVQAGTAPVTLDLLAYNLDKNRMAAEVIQAQLRENLGIQVNVELFDPKAFRAQIDLGVYPMWQGMWGADYPDPDNFLGVFLSSSGNNRTGWKNAAYDQWVDQARTMQSAAERRKLYAQAEALLIDREAAIVPLFYEPLIALISRRTKGIELNPLNYLYLRGVNLN
jgi:oligopeptide transport system substrate-binding protein